MCGRWIEMAGSGLCIMYVRTIRWICLGLFGGRNVYRRHWDVIDWMGGSYRRGSMIYPVFFFFGYSWRPIIWRDSYD